MAVVGNAEVVVGPSFKGFQSATAKEMAKAAGTASKSFTGSTEKAGIGKRMASTIGKGLMTGVKVTGGAMAGVLGYSLVKGFQRLNSIEQAQAKLKGLGNSAKDVQAIMDNALASVKGTAFGLDEAATVAASAVAAGVKPGKELTKYLTLTADAATIAGTSMGDMGSILNKVTASGKAQNDTLKQLADKGIPIYQLLGKQLHKSTSEIFDMASAGQISAKQLQDALQKGLGGAALSAGSTVQGAFKNMQAALGRFGAAFLEKLFPHLQKSFVNITTFIDNMTDAVGPVADVIGKVLGGALEKVTGALAKFDPTKVVNFFKNLGKQKKDAQGFGATLSGVVSSIKDFVKGIDFSAILNSLAKGFQSILPSIKQLMGALPSIASGVGKGFLDFWNALVPSLQKLGPAAATVGGTLGAVLGKAIGFVSDHIETIIKILPTAIGAFIAYKKAGQALAVSQDAIRLAQLKMLPVTTLNNALRVTANILERQNTTASLKNAAAKDVETASEAAGNAVKKKSLVQMAAMKAAQLAQAVASKAVAAAQWLVNAAMSANPIGLVVIAIAALVAGFIVAYKKSATFRKIVQGALNGVKAAALAVVNWFTKSFVPFFTKTIPGAFNKVLNWVKKNWKAILGWITNPIGSAVTLVIKHKDKILSTFKNLANWASKTFKKLWGKVSGFLTAPVKAGYNAVKKHLSSAQDRFNDLKKNISGKWKKGWNGAKHWIGDAVNNGKKAASTALDKTKTAFVKLKDWGNGKFKKGWSNMKYNLSHPVQFGKNLIDKSKKGMQKTFNALDNFGRKIFGKRWNGMKEVFTRPIKKVVNYFKKVFGKGGGGIRQVFSDFITGAKNIFNKLPNAVQSPIRKLIGFLNTKLIRGGINWLLKKLGVSGKNLVDWIPDPKFANGGIFMKNRYTPGKDIGYAKLSGYESIMRPEFTRAAGEDWVNQANAAARRGGVSGAKSFLASHYYGKYAGGGVVKPTKSGRQNASYPGHSGIDFFGNVGDPIFAVTDGRITYEGTGRGYGNAIFETSNKGMPMVYGHTSAYVAHQGQNVKAGQLIGRVGYSGNVRPAGPAGAHLHFEVAPNGFAKSGNRALSENYLSGGGLVSKIIGGISGALDFLKGLSPVKWLMNKASDMTGNLANLGGVLGRGFVKIPGMIIDKAKDWIGEKITAFTANDQGVNATWSGASVGSLGKDQLNVAATIIKTAKALGFGTRGAEIGLMTALQESTLRNLSGGDRDSVGAFQQRAPWGSYADRHNVATAAAMFFNGGHGGQPGLRAYNWKSLPLGVAAQRVQVSAYPDAYNKWENLARQLVTRGYSSGTMNAKSGLAWVHRNELVDFRGGERVYNQKMLQAIGGQGNWDGRVKGRLTVDADGLTALIDSRASNVADRRGRQARRRNNLQGVH